MRHLVICTSLAIGLALVLATTGVAADKADPTGTWKYTVKTPMGDFEIVLTLKLDGGKLTGATKRAEMETKIEDPKFKDGEVSFQVKREVNGNEIIAKYKGKLEGDTIKGKINVTAGGMEIDPIDWDAKREKK